MTLHRLCYLLSDETCSESTLYQNYAFCPQIRIWGNDRSVSRELVSMTSQDVPWHITNINQSWHVYIGTCIYMYMYVYLYLYKCVYIYLYKCLYMRMYIYTDVCICIYIQIYTKYRFIRNRTLTFYNRNFNGL